MEPEHWITLLTGLVRRVESRRINPEDVVLARQIRNCTWLNALANGTTNPELTDSLAEVVRDWLLMDDIDMENG